MGTAQWARELPVKVREAIQLLSYSHKKSVIATCVSNPRAGRQRLVGHRRLLVSLASLNWGSAGTERCCLQKQGREWRRTCGFLWPLHACVQVHTPCTYMHPSYPTPTQQQRLNIDPQTLSQLLMINARFRPPLKNF